MVFAIFALTGWDAAAPLAEESARPRRTVSRGVVLSILLMGFFLVVASWGLQIGWGTAHVGSFVNDGSNPAFSIAHRVWGSAWVLVLIALANSVIAVLISSMNAATRMWFRMARVGVLPRWLGYVHPRFKTPSNAIIAQTLLSLLLAFGLSAAWGVENVFSVLGFLFIFGAIPVWALANYSRVPAVPHGAPGRVQYLPARHRAVHRHRRAALVRLQVGRPAAAVSEQLGPPAGRSAGWSSPS